MVPALKSARPCAAVHHHGHTFSWRKRSLRTAEEIVPAIEDILAKLKSNGYRDKEMFAIHLALEEALVNAIKHGHAGDPSKEVQLRYHLTAEQLLIEVEDEGPGFKPEALPDPSAPENLERPCGRGLLLMRRYMTWVRFNDTGNRVTMCWRR